MASPAASLSVPIDLGEDRVRVVIADETPLGCELLKKVLGSHSCIQVVGTVFSAQELLARVTEAATELLLINVDLYEGHLSGLSAVSELHASLPKLPIIVICDRACDDLLLRSFRAGARGFLCRSDSLGQLCKCIQVVHQGQVWASSAQLQVLLGALVQAPPVRIANANGFSLLAERERQVVGLVSEALTNREIATRMGISEHTASNYLFRIYNKLGISNRVELVLYAMKSHERSRVES